MEANIEPKWKPRAFQDALGAGLPLEAIWLPFWFIFGPLEPLKTMLSL